MSKKNIFLLVVLAALIGATFIVQRDGTGSSGGLKTGDPLVADLDLDALSSVRITGPEGTNALASKDGRWVVESLYGFPLQFEKLSELVDKLAELEIGQVVDSGVTNLAEFGLADEAVVVELLAGGGDPIAAYTIGQSRESGSGRYMLAGEDSVVLVDEDFYSLPESGDDLIEKKLLDLSSDRIESITVTKEEEVFTMKVIGGSAYYVAGLAKNEEIDKGDANRLARALSYFNLVSVVDPSKPDKETGLGEPSTFTAQAQNGVTYSVRVGNKVDEGEDRYIRIDASFTEPPAPTEADAEKELGAKPEGAVDEDWNQALADRLSALKTGHTETVAAATEEVERVVELKHWIYTASSSSVEALLLTRKDVVQEKPEEEKPTEPAPPVEVRPPVPPPVAPPPPPVEPKPAPPAAEKAKPEEKKPEVKASPELTKAKAPAAPKKKPKIVFSNPVKVEPVETPAKEDPAAEDPKPEDGEKKTGKESESTP